MPPVPRRREGPAAAWLLALLLVWGSAGTSVLDGWLHATRGASPVSEAVAHECAWCRAVTTPLAPDPGAPEVDAVAALARAAAPRPPSAVLLTRPCRTPPARGPPAA
jgi:hypothetical protein